MRIRRDMSAFTLVSSLLVLGAPWSPTVAQFLGPEFQVNSFTTSYQGIPDVAVDGSNGFVVVWNSYGQEGQNHGVFGQRFDSNGSAVGTEFQVNTYTTGDQYSPKVAAAALGDFMVVWDSNGQDGSGHGVFGQRFDSTSAPLGSEFRINSYTTGDQWQPEIVAADSGETIVVWQSGPQDGSGSGVYGQRFTSTGSPSGGEFLINSSTTGEQLHPDVAIDAQGNFVVVWMSQHGANQGVFGQRFNSVGGPVGNEFLVNADPASGPGSPAVGSSNSGSFTVVWDAYQSGSSFGVVGQRFDPVANPLGSTFQVNTYTTGLQLGPSVAEDGSGNFAVVWTSPSQDGSDHGAFGQRYDSSGTRLGSEFQVNSFTPAGQRNPRIAAQGSGNFVVAWYSNVQDGSFYGVFGRRLSSALYSDGFNAGDACRWSGAVGGGC